VTLSSFSGVGTVGISIAANTATNSLGSAGVASSSATVQVTNSTPTWVDVTTAVDGSASSCSVTATRCSYKQVLTGKEWTKTLPPTRDVSVAINLCATGIGSYNGKSGWYLPSVDELGVAYNGVTTNGIFNPAGSQIFFPVANRDISGIKTMLVVGSNFYTEPPYDPAMGGVNYPLWSSTGHPNAWQGNWVVYPWSGYVDNGSTNQGLVMCVR
jgi:hypothetical protein